ncbi:PEP-CTERM sorting domain-containing protein [Sphingosinithalassobacter portus]|uniref:PEP-CTERM sorting domain-containing protein n=1 Tax=Stakelama portus TaxID=2676234 RepID=UPI000D6E3E61|nr:PEP-CTERM sorting domain-containing protein [Sphingosinithalassobacter portus]
MRHIRTITSAALLAAAVLPAVAQASSTPPESTPGGGGGQGTSGSPTSVPEPGTLGLLGGGIVAVALARRARRRKS